MADSTWRLTGSAATLDDIADMMVKRASWSRPILAEDGTVTRSDGKVLEGWRVVRKGSRWRIEHKA